MKPNPDIISIGSDYWKYSRDTWGTEDFAHDAARKAQSRRLRGMEPLTEQEQQAGIPGGLYGPDKSAERRRRAADRVLQDAGLRRRPW